MHLSTYGIISLDGSVSKPEPGLDFANYQIAMIRYTTTKALQDRLAKRLTTSETNLSSRQITPPRNMTSQHPKTPAGAVADNPAVIKTATRPHRRPKAQEMLPENPANALVQLYRSLRR